MNEIGLFETIYSARAIRHFRPEPIPDELLTQILEAAIRAPSAGNGQHWLFAVVPMAPHRRHLQPRECLGQTEISGQQPAGPHDIRAVQEVLHPRARTARFPARSWRFKGVQGAIAGTRAAKLK